MPNFERNERENGTIHLKLEGFGHLFDVGQGFIEIIFIYIITRGRR